MAGIGTCEVAGDEFGMSFNGVGVGPASVVGLTDSERLIVK